jgi:hypothetical protein
MPLREELILGHVWPIFLRIGGVDLFLVDDTDPALRPLWDGESVLGWEGDDRLRVYACPDRASWELVRYEATGFYTSINRIIETGSLSIRDIVGRWIVWLCEHDGRRGHDALAAQDAVEAAVEAERDKALTDKLENEIEPRFNHALRRDGEDAPGGIW